MKLHKWAPYYIYYLNRYIICLKNIHFGKDNKKYFNFKDFNKPLKGNYIILLENINDIKQRNVYLLNIIYNWI